MDHIRLEPENGILTVVLARPKANAIHQPMMEEIHSALNHAARDASVKGIVLASACPGFFSAGFDVREVFEYDRPRMGAFFGRFVQVYEALRGLPKPAVAALGGHTFAGGSILALACDLRIMARGEFGFGVSEINLGLVLPEEIGRMLTEAVGVARARELLLTGEPVSPERAFAIGLVNELAETGTVRERAVERAGLLASKPATAFAEAKRALRGTPGNGASEVDRFLELWFSPEAAEARRRIARNVGSGKPG